MQASVDLSNRQASTARNDPRWKLKIEELGPCLSLLRSFHGLCTHLQQATFRTPHGHIGIVLVSEHGLSSRCCKQEEEDNKRDDFGRSFLGCCCCCCCRGPARRPSVSRAIFDFRRASSLFIRVDVVVLDLAIHVERKLKLFDRHDDGCFSFFFLPPTTTK